MKKYQSKVTDKKKLVRKLEALTGKTATYTRVPRCAYQIGAYFVEKDGNLTAEHEQETDAVVMQLQTEGLLGDEVQEGQSLKDCRVRENTRPEQPVAPVFITPVTELWEPEASVTDAQETGNAVEEGTIAETSASDHTDGEDRTEETEQSTVQEVAWEIPGLHLSLPRREHLEDPSNGIAQAAETAEAGAEHVADNTESMQTTHTVMESFVQQEEDDLSVDSEISENADSEENQSKRGFPQNLAVSFPLESHSSNSLRNLINTIYSRGKLLTKATGGDFSCNAELIQELNYESSLHTAEQVISFVKDYENSHGACLQGLSFEEDKVCIDGFTNVADAEHLQSYMVLAEKINKACILQNHVQAKEVDDANERYAFRTWLNRLGMKGAEYKLARKQLLEHLSGHSAFRTKEEEERAKQKALRNRENI
ncbi:MAG: hypothetical protein PHN80_08470 [Hespellia sp.]|nr:hypothetical protein [Hespellia sp.]